MIRKYSCAMFLLSIHVMNDSFAVPDVKQSMPGPCNAVSSEQGSPSPAILLLAALRDHRTALQADDKKNEQEARKKMYALLDDKHTMEILDQAEDLASQEHDGAIIADIKFYRKMSKLNCCDAIEEALAKKSSWLTWNTGITFVGGLVLGGVAIWTGMRYANPAGINVDTLANNVSEQLGNRIGGSVAQKVLEKVGAYAINAARNEAGRE